MRSAADGSGASGATDPFAAVGNELPSGVTKLSGGGPSHGPSTRVSYPRTAQFAGQAEDLGLDATRHRQAVRADEPDPERRGHR